MSRPSSLVVLFAALAMGATISSAAEKEFVYSQSTGKLSFDGVLFGSGYSGKGPAKNDPGKENEKNAGPIPRGLYRMGQPRVYKGMADCIDLTPTGHDAHGRTEFLIHGDSKSSPGDASEGCIILPVDVRKKVAGSGVSRLRVVKE